MSQQLEMRHLNPGDVAEILFHPKYPQYEGIFVTVSEDGAFGIGTRHNWPWLENNILPVRKLNPGDTITLK